MAVDYSGKGTESLDVLTGDQELEVCTSTYGPVNDRSQHTKSVSHIIRIVIASLKRIVVTVGELLQVKYPRLF